MPISNYPSGFANGVSIQGMPVLNTYGGNVFWVSSAAGSDSNPGTRQRPFATIDYTVGRCTANNGDLIMVMPNHTETFSAADGIAFDVAGITVVGMGTYNQRPLLIFDTANTADVNVSAADVTLQNLVFEAGFADIARAIQITAVGTTLLGLEFRDQAVDENWLTPIKATGTTDNEADGLTVRGCRWTSIDAACTEFIELNADTKYLVVEDNFVVTAGTASPLILMATGKDMQEGKVTWNFLQNAMTAGDLLIDNDTAVNTGIVAHNRVKHVDVTGAHSLVDVDGVGLFDNLSTSSAVLSGFVLPAIDVDL